MKSCEHCSHEDCKNIGGTWYCLECPECGVKQKAEPHYRPFKDTDELIKVWGEKGGKWQKRDITMPLIWVCEKGEEYDRGRLITSYTRTCIELDDDVFTVDYLFNNYTFLDGSVCGVEE